MEVHGTQVSFCYKCCSFLLLFLPCSSRTILISAGNSNGFTTWLKLNPYIQDHINSHVHQSLFLAWEVLEHGLKKCGFNWWWSLITNCWSSYKVWEILEHTHMMLQFRLLLNNLCVFEVVTSYWSVTHPSQKFAGTVDVFGKIWYWYEYILTQFLGKPNCFFSSFLQRTSCFVFKLKESKIVFWFHQTQQYWFLFYYDNMFQSTDHHEAISSKLRTGCIAVQITFLEYGIP
jgi:hypothetical protein